MGNKEKKIVGIALNLASDKRKHLLYKDCLSWFERKMKEIRWLLKLLPYVPYNKITKDDKDLKEIFKKGKRRDKKGYFDTIETEYIKTIEQLEENIIDIIFDEIKKEDVDLKINIEKKYVENLVIFYVEIKNVKRRVRIIRKREI